MSGESVFKEIKQRSEEFLRLSHHDKFHVDRVHRLAVQIAEKEKADLEVVRAAVLLHDIARAMEDEDEIDDHSIEGAEMAKKVLEEIGFPKKKIDKVVHCIKVHRYKKGVKTESLEAKILQDADRLDIIGAIGVARVFMRGGWGNTPMYDPLIPPKMKYDGKSESCVNHIFEKILKVKDALNTVTAREIAKARHDYVEEFLERFFKEWEGET